MASLIVQLYCPELIGIDFCKIVLLFGPGNLLLPVVWLVFTRGSVRSLLINVENLKLFNLDCMFLSCHVRVSE